MKKENPPKVKKISTRGLLVHGAWGRSVDEFIKIARMIHGDRYGYGRVVYRDYRTPVELICPDHGPFSITPDALLSKARGCPACGRESRIRKRTKPYKEFLAQVRALYGKKYTFDETTYRSTNQKMKVTCPLHGEFRQTPAELLHGYACPQCGRHKPMNNGRFFREVKQIHGDKYDYSKAGEITGIDQYITIICPKHGEFTQLVNSHIRGQGCAKCGFDTMKAKTRLPFAEFLKRARKIHGSKYRYDEASYVNMSTPIPVTCPVHGVFAMVPKNHIRQEHGCPVCGRERAVMKKRMTFDGFVRRARQAHGKKYRYDEASYESLNARLTITCPEHGPFTQRGADHIAGHGCPLCGRASTTARRRVPFDEFVRRAREIHGKKYQYDKASYESLETKLTITCPEHGAFTQQGGSHLSGRGCPVCGRENTTAKGRTPFSEFVRRAREIHGKKYRYDEASYESLSAKLTITCPEHGEFTQQGDSHLSGRGCPVCARERTIAAHRGTSRKNRGM
jgi:ssDNA-binding Zn-finger/Zn-ribbon topoisomerase 1